MGAAAEAVAEVGGAEEGEWGGWGGGEVFVVEGGFYLWLLDIWKVRVEICVGGATLPGELG